MERNHCVRGRSVQSLGQGQGKVDRQEKRERWGKLKVRSLGHGWRAEANILAAPLLDLKIMFTQEKQVQLGRCLF